MAFINRKVKGQGKVRSQNSFSFEARPTTGGATDEYVYKYWCKVSKIIFVCFANTHTRVFSLYINFFKVVSK